MKYAPLSGRILFALIFLMSAPNLFSTGSIQYAAAHGVPVPSVAVPVAGVLAFVGGLSLLLGFEAKWGAVLLLLFLVPVTLMMHDFWAVKDLAAARTQLIDFMENVALMGGALFVLYFGAGPVSLDAWLASRRLAQPAPGPAAA